jgi:hypothetical protein
MVPASASMALLEDNARFLTALAELSKPGRKENV